MKSSCDATVELSNWFSLIFLFTSRSTVFLRMNVLISCCTISTRPRRLIYFSSAAYSISLFQTLNWILVECRTWLRMGTRENEKQRHRKTFGGFKFQMSSLAVLIIGGFTSDTSWRCFRVGQLIYLQKKFDSGSKPFKFADPQKIFFFNQNVIIIHKKYYD
jgi:hypothetical protein